MSSAVNVFVHAICMQVPKMYLAQKVPLFGWTNLFVLSMYRMIFVADNVCIGCVYIRTINIIQT